MTRRPATAAQATGPAASAEVLRPAFWQLPLGALTAPEWEALCDGCGKCCVLKLEDEDTGAVHYTDVACRLFDPATRRCGQYALRRRLVPGCVRLSPGSLAEAAAWLPETCAYRLRHQGQPLADWHPLISGDRESVARAGHAVGPTVPEYEVAEEDLEDHIVEDF